MKNEKVEVEIIGYTLLQYLEYVVCDIRRGIINSYFPCKLCDLTWIVSTSFVLEENKQAANVYCFLSLQQLAPDSPYLKVRSG